MEPTILETVPTVNPFDFVELAPQWPDERFPISENPVEESPRKLRRKFREAVLARLEEFVETAELFEGNDVWPSKSQAEWVKAFAQFIG